MVGDTLSQIGGVTGIEVTVLGAAQDVDVVHGLRIGRGGAWVLGCREIACVSTPYVGPRKVRASRETTGLLSREGGPSLLSLFCFTG